MKNLSVTIKSSNVIKAITSLFLISAFLIGCQLTASSQNGNSNWSNWKPVNVNNCLRYLEFKYFFSEDQYLGKNKVNIRFSNKFNTKIHFTCKLYSAGSYELLGRLTISPGNTDGTYVFIKGNDFKIQIEKVVFGDYTLDYWVCNEQTGQYYLPNKASENLSWSSKATSSNSTGSKNNSTSSLSNYNTNINRREASRLINDAAYERTFGNYTTAIEYLKKAKQLDPTNKKIGVLIDSYKAIKESQNLASSNQNSFFGSTPVQNDVNSLFYEITPKTRIGMQLMDEGSEFAKNCDFVSARKKFLEAYQMDNNLLIAKALVNDIDNDIERFKRINNCQ